MFEAILGPLNIVDLLLIAGLVLAIPAFQLWKSLQAKSAPKASAAQRFARSLFRIGVPLLLLAADWRTAGRNASSLGLDIPVSFRGEIGLAIACVVIIVFAANPLLQKRTTEKDAALRARLDEAGMLAETPRDLVLFVLLALLIGCGWELLYRGFL